MINDKRAKSTLITYLSAALLSGVILIVVFSIVGVGGGFSALWDVGTILGKMGDVLTQIPIWVYVGVAAIWLLKEIVS